MAGCEFTKPWSDPSCDDKFNVPGVNHQEVFIANVDDVTGFTETSEGEIDAIAFNTYKGLMKLIFHRDTVQITETLVSGNNAGDHYTQEFVARTIDDSTSVRNAINELVGVDVYIIAKKKNGKFAFLGESEGLKLTGNEKASGAASGDDTGDLLTFTGVNLGKHKYFFDTSAAQSATTLQGYVDQHVLPS